MPVRWCRLKRTHIHNAIKTICRESKCKSRAELAKLAWAIMPRCSFAYSKKKNGSEVLAINFNLSSSYFFFPLCLKRDYRKSRMLSEVAFTPPMQQYCAILPRMWKGDEMKLRLRKNDRQSCTVVPKMYLITSLYLSFFTKISSKSRIFTLKDQENRKTLLTLNFYEYLCKVKYNVE